MLTLSFNRCRAPTQRLAPVNSLYSPHRSKKEKQP